MNGSESSASGEFERGPVPNHALLGAGKFWGMYAGEHAAGTEFMIGPLFLAAGASLQDLILGLLLGNVLAILTWRYLVTPIAVNKLPDTLLPARANRGRIAGQILQRDQWRTVLLPGWCDDHGLCQRGGRAFWGHV